MSVDIFLRELSIPLALEVLAIETTAGGLNILDISDCSQSGPSVTHVDSLELDEAKVRHEADVDNPTEALEMLWL